MKNVENGSRKTKELPAPITSGARRQSPIYSITIPLYPMSMVEMTITFGNVIDGGNYSSIQPLQARRKLTWRTKLSPQGGHRADPRCRLPYDLWPQDPLLRHESHRMIGRKWSARQQILQRDFQRSDGRRLVREGGDPTDW